ncbi:MAG: hypothetical protein Q4B26_02295 [Eubacteriales bacterium]|nr:hypothetical protein [Eubacteriales bacterium]
MKKNVIAVVLCVSLLTGCSVADGAATLFLGESISKSTYSRTAGEICSELLDLDNRIVSVEIKESEEAFLFIPKTKQKIIITAKQLPSDEMEKLTEKVRNSGITGIESDAEIMVKGE